VYIVCLIMHCFSMCWASIQQCIQRARRLIQLLLSLLLFMKGEIAGINDVLFVCNDVCDVFTMMLYSIKDWCCIRCMLQNADTTISTVLGRSHATYVTPTHHSCLRSFQHFDSICRASQSSFINLYIINPGYLICFGATFADFTNTITMNRRVELL